MKVKEIRKTAKVRLAKIANAVQDGLWTIPGLAGMAMVSYGAALIFLPAGIIVGGICLIVLDSRL